MAVTHLLLITNPEAAKAVMAAWQRVLPEDDLAGIHSEETTWKGDVIYTLNAKPEYIQALIEIIDDMLSPGESLLIKPF
jgi:hypothetical protein